MQCRGRDTSRTCRWCPASGQPVPAPAATHRSSARVTRSPPSTPPPPPRSACQGLRQPQRALRRRRRLLRRRRRPLRAPHTRGRHRMWRRTRHWRTLRPLRHQLSLAPRPPAHPTGPAASSSRPPAKSRWVSTLRLERLRADARAGWLCAMLLKMVTPPGPRGRRAHLGAHLHLALLPLGDRAPQLLHSRPLVRQLRAVFSKDDFLLAVLPELRRKGREKDGARLQTHPLSACRCSCTRTASAMLAN